MATVGRPAVTADTICGPLGKTSVSGPGHRARVRSSAASGHEAVYRLATGVLAT